MSSACLILFFSIAYVYSVISERVSSPLRRRSRLRLREGRVDGLVLSSISQISTATSHVPDLQIYPQRKPHAMWHRFTLSFSIDLRYIPDITKADFRHEVETAGNLNKNSPVLTLLPFRGFTAQEIHIHMRTWAFTKWGSTFSQFYLYSIAGGDTLYTGTKPTNTELIHH